MFLLMTASGRAVGAWDVGIPRLMRRPSRRAVNGSFAARYHCVNGSTRDGRAPAAPCRFQGDLHERADVLVDLRVRPPEGSELLIDAALDLGWVLQSPVEPFPVAGKDRADRPRAIAHGDHVVERLAHELVGRLAPRARQIKARISEHTNREWVDALGLRAGGIDLEVHTSDALQDRLGHLAARTVPRAHEEDADGLGGLHASTLHRQVA